jgi:hypothetical protein
MRHEYHCITSDMCSYSVVSVSWKAHANTPDLLPALRIFQGYISRVRYTHRQPTIQFSECSCYLQKLRSRAESDSQRLPEDYGKAQVATHYEMVVDIHTASSRAYRTWASGLVKNNDKSSQPARWYFFSQNSCDQDWWYIAHRWSLWWRMSRSGDTIPSTLAASDARPCWSGSTSTAGPSNT